MIHTQNILIATKKFNKKIFFLLKTAEDYDTRKKWKKKKIEKRDEKQLLLLTVERNASAHSFTQTISVLGGMHRYFRKNLPKVLCLICIQREHILWQLFSSSHHTHY